MKKILLATAAFALTALSVQAAATDAKTGPALKFSGQMTTNFYMHKQSAQNSATGAILNKGRGGGHHFSVDDSRFNADVFYKADGLNALEYGFLVGINLDASNTTAIQEARLKFKNSYGTLLLGVSRGFDDFGAVGAFSVMGATGGFAGDYKNVLNVSTGVVAVVDLAGAPKDATKMTYVTPRAYGFQAGLSFTPNTAHKGEAKLANNVSLDVDGKAFDKNQFGFGVNYKKSYGDVNVAASLTTLMGRTKAVDPTSTSGTYFTAERKATKSYALGATVGYKDWMFGAEWIDNGKSQQEKLNGADAGKVWSAALGYTYGVDQFTFGYLGSTRNMGFNATANLGKAKAQVFSLTWDHKLAPGLSVYAEANCFDYKTTDAAVAAQNNVAYINNLVQGVQSNRGHVFILGSKVKF